MESFDVIPYLVGCCEKKILNQKLLKNIKNLLKVRAFIDFGLGVNMK